MAPLSTEPLCTGSQILADKSEDSRAHVFLRITSFQLYWSQKSPQSLSPARSLHYPRGMRDQAAAGVS